MVGLRKKGRKGKINSYNNKKYKYLHELKKEPHSRIVTMDESLQELYHTPLLLYTNAIYNGELKISTIVGYPMFIYDKHVVENFIRDNIEEDSIFLPCIHYKNFKKYYPFFQQMKKPDKDKILHNGKIMVFDWMNDTKRRNLPEDIREKYNEVDRKAREANRIVRDIVRNDILEDIIREVQTSMGYVVWKDTDYFGLMKDKEIRSFY
ncbi:hypothetical protein ACFL1H_03480 [Nanoarchaeota archaeon]